MEDTIINGILDKENLKDSDITSMLGTLKTEEKLRFSDEKVAEQDEKDYKRQKRSN